MGKPFSQTKPLFCMSLAPDFQAAECLLNPYGEDDDDFETNLLIDTNIQSCYLYVDTVSASTQSHNPTTTTIFWSEPVKVLKPFSSWTEEHQNLHML